MSTITKFRVGDTVHITAADSPKFAGTYRITKINPSTYGLANDTVPNLKAPHSMVRAGALPGETAIGVPYVATEYFEPGTVVRMSGVRGADGDRLFVVVANSGNGFRVFPLGGSSRYYRGVPAHRLTRVTEIKNWSAE